MTSLVGGADTFSRLTRATWSIAGTSGPQALIGRSRSLFRHIPCRASSTTSGFCMRGLNLSFRTSATQVDRLSHRSARVPSPLIDEEDDLAHAQSVTNPVLAAIPRRYRAIPRTAYPRLWYSGTYWVLTAPAGRNGMGRGPKSRCCTEYLHITAHTCSKEKRVWSKGIRLCRH